MAAFDGIAASVGDPAAADAFLRTHWGEAVFASLDRTTWSAPIPPEWAANGVEPSTRVTYRPRRTGGG